jgi:maltooligosyltrehalose trehalohydrolase
MRSPSPALRRPLGAAPVDPDAAEFRVWAPNASSVAVRIGAEEHELAETEGGAWEGEAPARAGSDYLYVLDRAAAWPDPCSRFQPEGIRGPSRVVDLGAFEWTDKAWAGLTLEELVLYELHVGTFTREGTFGAVVSGLRELRELGVTAIELMPVVEGPGLRGWGYDGLYVYAPHRAYGGPGGLARLVDAAHAEDLGVIVDVVYNHLGPGNERISAFGPYLTDRYETPWGQALDYAEDGVREWALQNACMWVRDYHVDGFRLDAVFAVHDESPRHVLAELADRVRELEPRTLVISEMAVGDLRPVEEWGHDAQWADELHHEQHVLVTGERDGYYAGYRGSVADLARQLERTPPERFVFCVQNHDQVGNRAVGDRPPAAAARLQAALLLFAPHTPLIFMGQEYGERNPFQYFTDHVDPAIAEATREGRRREFGGFAGFSAEDVPDPQAPETFERSKLDPARGDPELRAFYGELLRLRGELPREVTVAADEERRILRVRRGSVELVADFANLTAELVRA